MKRLKNRSGALLLALALASCSQGPTAPTSAKPATASAASDGVVNGSAAGDVKTGPVDMDMNLIRVSQTNGVAAFYANLNGEYTVHPGRDTEIYVQIWTSNPVVQNPRLIVDWGDGERDNIGCGACRLSKRYNNEGRYRVTVTLDDRVSSFTTRSFTLNVKSDGSGSFSFANNNMITINDNAPGTPYPSTIDVSGLTGGRIVQASVTIYGYTHTWQGDVALLLVAPNGRTVSLMNNGPACCGSSNDANNATVTFEDGAPAFTTSNFGPGSFTFAPVGTSGTVLPAPAPGGGGLLSSLAGVDPNGTWKLFVFDDEAGDIGQIAGGWSINFQSVGSSSVGAVQASGAGVSASSWPSNDHILNYPFQKPDPQD